MSATEDHPKSASELRKVVNEHTVGAGKLPRVKFMTKKEREKMAKEMEKEKKQAAKEKAEDLRKRWYYWTCFESNVVEPKILIVVTIAYIYFFM